MKYKILLIFIFSILLVNYVTAFGVTAFSWDENPLILNPGEIRDVELLLQNEKTSAPITVQAELNSDIAVLSGRTVFDLKTGETGISVPIIITIPETAEIGDKFSVGVGFRTVADHGEGKMLEFGTKITKSIPIVIGKIIIEEEQKKSLTDIIPLESMGGILLVLIVIILAIFILYRKKKKK